MELSKCSAESCLNLTVKSYERYGTYCFKHSYLTYDPKTIKTEVVNNSTLLSESVELNSGEINNPPTILQVNPEENLVVKPIRRAPLPSRPSRVYREYHHDSIKCGTCDNVSDINNKMKCGHFVCDDCLDIVRSMECPCCSYEMEGPLLTPFNIEQIQSRYNEDREYFE